MKLAITDACIFIDLIELQLSSEFFSLPIEIHTSLDVYNELDKGGKEILKAYRSVGKLLVHNITSEERTLMLEKKYPRTLSSQDQTVLFLAEKLKALVISSDKPVRNYAKSKAIEYHGMLWIFDKLVDLNLLKPKDAIFKIDRLVTENIIYQNNAVLTTEIEKRKLVWESL